MSIRSVQGFAEGLLVLFLTVSGLAQEPARPAAPAPAGNLLKAVGQVLREPPAQPRITAFTLGGFQVERVEAAAGASPAQFSGEGYLVLPAPLESLPVTFQNLVLAGTIATGQISATLAQARDDQGWHYAFTGVRISDQGSHALGTLAAAWLRITLDTATLSPSGFSGTLALGDVPLAEGPFTATLKAGLVLFSAQAPVLQGTVEVAFSSAFHDADSGAPVTVSAPASFGAPALTDAGTVVDALATNLGVASQGLVFRLAKLSFAFDRGVPWLRGGARLGFPLQIFCLASSTGQPYLTQSGSAAMAGTAPAGPVTLPATGIKLPPPEARLGGKGPAAPVGGFSGSFPLAAATVLPSGIGDFHLNLASGTIGVKDGVPDPGSTSVTGSLTWGPGYASEVDFQNAPAALADGFYLTAGVLKGEVPVGAYGVQAGQAPAVVDFSTSQSPNGMPPAWKGVYLPAYLVALPEPFFTFDPAWNRLTVFARGRNGVFEADGGFSGQVAVNLPGPVLLSIVPVKLDPFELQFADGALLDMPHVTGMTQLDQPPVLPAFDLPVSFDLTQQGPQRILLQTHAASGDTTLKTDLVGVDMVLSGAVLNPTNLDLSGRFDFHLKGAPLPSVPFDHMVLEASGGGLDGKKGPISLAMAGALWSNLQGDPKLSLWGYGFAMEEDGYGTLSDGRFFVGFGGEMDINPVLPSMYNRVLLTTEPNDPATGTVQMENGFSVNQALAGLGSLQGSLDFKVDTASDQVSDAYFLGTGKVNLAMGDSPLNLDAGFRFGQSFTQPQPFPYFYLLGQVTFPAAGIDVAPDVEIYGLAGGVCQNFLPDDITNTTTITGKADNTLGMAIMAGVDLGTSDEYTFHGDLDLYVAQDLTTLVQGQGYLFAGREDSPPDRSVSADLSFTRNPNAFHAVLDADLSFYGGLMRFLGEVELKFDPTNHFIHIGTKAAPIQASYLDGMTSGTGYFDADFSGRDATLSTGGGFSLDTGQQNFGPCYGRAWLSASGDLVVVVDSSFNPTVSGEISAQGGATFGMQFSTFWQNYNVTIFSGSLGANLAFQAPGSPTLDGNVDVSYDVLGGLFSGSVGVSLEF